MPRIRKKTSKRGSTNDRKKISQKVRESRKKKAKASKKSVEWRSKHKKDPGIPNTFPYKDQILAEVAEQRRLAAEDKQRRKDTNRALKFTAEDAQEVNTVDDGGIASISAKRLTARKINKPISEVEESEDEDDGAPVLINRDLPHLQAVLDQADVVIEVLDARDPLAFRSSHLEEIIQSKPGRKLLFVLNKIDCAPQEAVTAWISALRRQQPTFPFRSASSLLPTNPLAPVNAKGKRRAKNLADDALGVDGILECLNKWAEEKKDGIPLTVAVVGVTNTGKSSFIASLTKTPDLPIYSLMSSPRGPTTTTVPQEIIIQAAGRLLRFIDTPGFSWKTDKLSLETDEVRSRDILLRNKGRIDRLKDPMGAVAHLVSRANPEDLMLLYGLPAFPKGDVNAFISGIARSQQLVRKRGVLHLTGASKGVLRDWCIGKLQWYSTPPSDLTASTTFIDAWLQDLYAKADKALACLQSRKVMRKAGGLVRISPGEIDSREVMSEVSYAELETSSDENDDDRMDLDETGFGDDEENEEEMAEEEQEEEEEEPGSEYEEEVEVLPPSSRSQKRKRVDLISLPPKKKVSFTAKFQGSNSKSSLKSGSILFTSETSTVPSATKALKSTSQKVKLVAKTSSKNVPPKIPSDKGDGEPYDFGKYF